MADTEVQMRDRLSSSFVPGSLTLASSVVFVVGMLLASPQIMAAAAALLTAAALGALADRLFRRYRDRGSEAARATGLPWRRP